MENDKSTICDPVEQRADDKYISLLIKGAMSAGMKARHKKLSFKEAVKEASEQNRRFIEFQRSGVSLTNIKVYLNDAYSLSHTFKSCNICTIEYSNLKEGSTLEFWHCDENNERDFLLFNFVIPSCNIRGIIEDVSPTQAAGINLRYVPIDDGYYVKVCSGKKEDIRRDVQKQLGIDYDLFHGKYIEKTYIQSAFSRIKESIQADLINRAQTYRLVVAQAGLAVILMLLVSTAILNYMIVPFPSDLDSKIQVSDDLYQVQPLPDESYDVPKLESSVNINEFEAGVIATVESRRNKLRSNKSDRKFDSSDSDSEKAELRANDYNRDIYGSVVGHENELENNDHSLDTTSSFENSSAKH